MTGVAAAEASSVGSGSSRGSRATTGSSGNGSNGKVMVSAEVSVAPLQHCLRRHQLRAKVVDVDHYQKRLVRVSTDYIIEIQSLESSDSQFTYMISKTYHQCRKLCSKLKESSELATAGIKSARDFSKAAKFVVKFTDSVCKIIGSEPVKYVSKVSYTFVKKLAEERTRRLNDALEFITKNFPSADDDELMSEPCVKNLVKHIEDFFLTDHVVEEGQELPDYLKPEKHHHHSRSKSNGSSNHKKRNSGVFSLSPPPSRPATPTNTNNISSPDATSNASDKKSNNPPMSTISMKTRRSVVLRQADTAKLEKMGSSRSGLTIDETESPTKGARGRSADGEASSRKGANKGSWLLSTAVVITLMVVSVVVLKRAQYSSIQIDYDHLALICFVCFTLGVQFNSVTSARSKDAVHHESPLQVSKSARGFEETGGVKFSPSVEMQIELKSQGSLALLRKSMSSRKSLTSAASSRMSLAADLKSELDESPILTEEDEGQETSEGQALIQSPLRIFPKNGKPNVDLNCVSEAPHKDFPVRGPNYLTDGKKIPSKEMIFPCRGADLLLTDECPENVGRSSAILGGKLRDKPTFLINFRLPWGVLIFYYEIPEKFLPYVQKRYDPSWKNKDVPSIEHFTPSEKCVARFLMGSDEHKKESLKILPKVVIGPWVVKSVVGTKPAIIGNKLPVNYVYGPPDHQQNKSLYLEADLDIVASSAARKILGVVRSYTQSLTIDLGFLIEGKQFDELPEQMLVGTRLHGLDPLNASLLPPMPQDITNDDISPDDGSVDSSGTNR